MTKRWFWQLFPQISFAFRQTICDLWSLEPNISSEIFSPRNHSGTTPTPMNSQGKPQGRATCDGRASLSQGGLSTRPLCLSRGPIQGSTAFRGGQLNYITDFILWGSVQSPPAANRVKHSHQRPNRLGRVGSKETRAEERFAWPGKGFGRGGHLNRTRVSSSNVNPVFIYHQSISEAEARNALCAHNHSTANHCSVG